MLFQPFGAPGKTPKLEPQHHFRRRKNAISLHLAAFFALKRAPDNVKHEVLGFAETLKPCISRNKKQFFFHEVDGQMGEKRRFF